MRRCIYLIENEDNKHIKIGIGKNPKQRIKQLQTGSSAKLKLLYQREVEFASKVESMLHIDYLDYRVHGEWFSLEGFDFQDIDNKITLYEKNFIALKSGNNPFI